MKGKKHQVKQICMWEMGEELYLPITPLAINLSGKVRIHKLMRVKQRATLLIYRRINREKICGRRTKIKHDNRILRKAGNFHN